MPTNSAEIVANTEMPVRCQETPEGVFLEPPPKDADRRTAAERRFDEQMEKREAERIAKMTSKSHRQRVAEFNEHLGKLTEHMVTSSVSAARGGGGGGCPFTSMTVRKHDGDKPTEVCGKECCAFWRAQ